MGRIPLFSEIPELGTERLRIGRIEDSDAAGLSELMASDIVYRYLPTYLFERNHGGVHEVIADLYGEIFTNKENLILGIFLKDTHEFCGIAELYGLREEAHKISLGYRLLERFWGKGITTEAVRRMVAYLFDEADVDLCTASTMIANRASARVLEKCGFTYVIAADEDWGYAEPTLADKWFV